MILAGRRLALVACSAIAVAACATARTSREDLPDGAHRLRCRTSLPECLDEAERVCQGKHYIVLRAVDEHDHRGGPELNVDARTSDAIFRCGPAMAWPPDVDPMALAPAACPAPSAPMPTAVAPPSPARACISGSTQPCTGPGGCGGGQACLADGSGFGACDCGGDTTGLGRTR